MKVKWEIMLLIFLFVSVCGVLNKLLGRLSGIVDGLIGFFVIVVGV